MTIVTSAVLNKFTVKDVIYSRPMTQFELENEDGCEECMTDVVYLEEPYILVDMDLTVDFKPDYAGYYNDEYGVQYFCAGGSVLSTRNWMVKKDWSIPSRFSKIGQSNPESFKPW